jgi:hypothetical protein
MSKSIEIFRHVIIEKDTIHDPKFVKTREENFQKG